MFQTETCLNIESTRADKVWQRKSSSSLMETHFLNKQFSFITLQYKPSSKELQPSVTRLHSTTLLRKKQSDDTQQQTKNVCVDRGSTSIWGCECHIRFEAARKCVKVVRESSFYWKVSCVRSIPPSQNGMDHRYLYSVLVYIGYTAEWWRFVLHPSTGIQDRNPLLLDLGRSQQHLWDAPLSLWHL